MLAIISFRFEEKIIFTIVEKSTTIHFAAKNENCRNQQSIDANLFSYENLLDINYHASIAKTCSHKRTSRTNMQLHTLLDFYLQGSLQ